jgi:hypothetical protein
MGNDSEIPNRSNRMTDESSANYPGFPDRSNQSPATQKIAAAPFPEPPLSEDAGPDF